MAGAPPVSLLRLVLEDDDFRTAILLLDLCLDRGAGQQRRANPGRPIAADHEHPIEREVRALLDGKLLDRERVADRDAVLLAAGFDDGIWRMRLNLSRSVLALALGGCSCSVLDPVSVMTVFARSFTPAG